MPSISTPTDDNHIPLQPNMSSSSTITPPTATTPNLSLKRKRPPNIQIPLILSEMKKDDIKHREKIFQDQSIEFQEMGVGVFSKKGKKKLMEDTYKIVSSLHGNPNKGFFGVYDGHGGRKAAEFVAENLHGNILGMLEKSEGKMDKEEAIQAGYLKTDEEFLKQGISSGTCCVTCLIEEDIAVSNVGDCRAVLCRGGVAEALTVDHRAEQENERNRIETKGGYVEIHRGAWRVHGILSVSRSIGDAHLKDWVLAEPDTKILTLTSDMDFMVLASDGLWEKVGNQEAIDTVLHVRSGDTSQSTTDPWEDNDNEFTSKNRSPGSMSRRISLVNKHKMKTQSPKRVSSGLGKTGPTSDPWKKDEYEYGCENTSPPSKARKISLVKQQKLKIQSAILESRNYKKRPTSSGWLMDACKELVNLSESRGSFDDITVMIIDMGHFRSNT